MKLSHLTDPHVIGEGPLYGQDPLGGWHVPSLRSMPNIAMPSLPS